MKDTHQPTHPGLRQYAVLAWLRLARVFQKIDTRSERFFNEHKLNATQSNQHKLNTAQFDVLAQVGAARRLTQQELADALLVTKGNISQLLGKLEQAGLIRRQQEGRANYLSLTEAGQALFQKVVPQQGALIAEMLAVLTTDEQRELLRLLRELDHAIS
jgi:DNA-binding MarR family transcriptional regulator